MAKIGTIQYNKHYQRRIIVGLPFVRSDEARIYLMDDKYHREDGPAYIGVDGHEEYWNDGKELSEKEFKKRWEK